MHLRSWFKHPHNLIPEWQRFSFLLRLFHIASVSGAWEAHFVAAHVDESEGRLHHTSDVKAVIHWYGRRQNMRCSSSTDARDVKQVKVILWENRDLQFIKKTVILNLSRIAPLYFTISFLAYCI